MGEIKAVGRSVVFALGALCIILAAALTATITSYMSMIREKEALISSLNTQVSNLQEQVAELQDQVMDLQEQIKRVFGQQPAEVPELETVKLSWFNAWFTPDKTKLNATVMVTNRGGPVESVSVVFEFLFYTLGLDHKEHCERHTFEVGRLGACEWRVLEKSVDAPKGEGWHFSVSFIVYVNGAETDRRSFGCY